MEIIVYFTTPTFYMWNQQVGWTTYIMHTHARPCTSLVLMPVQMAETCPIHLLCRPGNKASSCTCKDQTTCMNIQACALEALTLTRAEMEEWVATPLDHSLILDYRVLCDDRSTLGIYWWTCLFIVKGLKISRTWLYWHAETFDVSACTGFLNIILALLTTYLTFAAWSWSIFSTVVTVGW